MRRLDDDTIVILAFFCLLALLAFAQAAADIFSK